MLTDGGRNGCQQELQDSSSPLQMISSMVHVWILWPTDAKQQLQRMGSAKGLKYRTCTWEGKAKREFVACRLPR